MKVHGKDAAVGQYDSGEESEEEGASSSPVSSIPGGQTNLSSQPLHQERNYQLNRVTVPLGPPETEDPETKVEMGIGTPLDHQEDEPGYT